MRCWGCTIFGCESPWHLGCSLLHGAGVLAEAFVLCGVSLGQRSSCTLQGRPGLTCHCNQMIALIDMAITT